MSFVGAVLERHRNDDKIRQVGHFFGVTVAKEKLVAQLIKKNECGGETAGVEEISGWLQPAGTENGLLACCR